MPVEFLTDEQAAAYGRFVEEPTRPELERFFFLDDVDRDLIALRRTTAHQLGFAVQMCTVRYVGRFLVDDPLDVPWSVIEYLAAQLGIEDPSVMKRYTERAKTAYEHAWEIRNAYGYHPFEDHEWGRKFRAFLHGRALRGRWRCFGCRRDGGSRSWSGCAGRRLGRRARAWPRPWSGWTRSLRSGWAG
ncbi:TnpA family transposase [Streptosporangium album]|uniref:TnpA family transposase n=1 Tax=Streptosporangium album TaxID=47479 RepID=A0A7W7RXG4_9ACTN|nr:DUF4158 domain-containing protein [Streptosporangium album]MBB4940024.1 TnpA family transposase [Streptosporangium album]